MLFDVGAIAVVVAAAGVNLDIVNSTVRRRSSCFNVRCVFQKRVLLLEAVVEAALAVLQ